MKGSTRVLLGALMIIFALSSVASAKDEYVMPVEKTLKDGTNVVRYDGISYHFSSISNISVTFDRIDDRYVELRIKTIDLYVPTVAVSIWWGDFPVNILDIEVGGYNLWVLDTETGYAEK